jgi:two-component system, LytTR family, response regulator
MKKLRVLIIDNESLARDRLRRLLAGESDVEIVGEAADGPAAVEAVRELAPDLLLLDIQMPGLDGFDVLKELRGAGELPAVVFVTAFDQHAVRAFESRALDYLLKPVTRARLQEALDRARERWSSAAGSKPTIPQGLLDLLAEREAATPKLRRVAIRTGERTTFVELEAIDWLEVSGNYVILHVGKETHILRETLANFEAQLPAPPFIRVSRSAILNLRRVREIQAVAAGEHVALLHDGQRIPITRSIREVEERMRYA